MKRGVKRAEVTSKALFFLFEMLLAILVLVALLSYVESLKDNTLFEKHHLTRDVSLLLNTISIAPGNLFYQYTNSKIDLDKFEFIFRDNKVEIRESQKDKASYISFPYSENALLNNQLNNIRSEKQLIFLKSGNEFITSSNRNLDKIKCKKSKQTTNNKTIIDIQDQSTSKQTDKIFSILKGIKDKGDSNYFEYTRDSKSIKDDQSIKNTKITDKTLYSFISITFGSYTNTNKNFIKAYYNIDSSKKETSKQLACEITNYLSDNFNVDGISIIPLNPEDIEKQNMKILDNDNSVIILEIGNLQNSRLNTLTNEELTKLGYSISNAIKGVIEN
jgi:hypothetical protein